MNITPHIHSYLARESPTKREDLIKEGVESSFFQKRIVDNNECQCNSESYSDQSQEFVTKRGSLCSIELGKHENCKRRHHTHDCHFSQQSESSKARTHCIVRRQRKSHGKYKKCQRQKVNLWVAVVHMYYERGQKDQQHPTESQSWVYFTPYV